MRDLTAQVTSSLLPFSGVTRDALGEDEINLDSVLHGKFTIGRSGLAWLACGPHLEVVHAVTGERLSAYCFSSGGEIPPTVLAARDFSWLKRSGLLVGLEESEGSVLCLYDLGLSRVVKAVLIPGRITAIEPLVSYGGASTLTQHLHQGLRWFFGIAAVVTDLGHVLLVDLCLDDLSCNQSELEASDLQVVTKSPAEIPRLREVSTREGRHLCLQLNAPSGIGATTLQYVSRTNQLAVGFSDGYLQLWNMKALKKEYHSQLEGGKVPVYAFTFQEPENDPRNCCYLWAVQSSQDLEGDVVSLHLLQLAFSERKCIASGKILYEGLEYCEERYSQTLSGTAFPLRAQATNTRLLSCLTIEKCRPHPDRDDSLNEVASPDTSVSIFCWQVRVYGQGVPTTYVGLFDINRWYHAQMPDSLRVGESLQNCPYLAVWSLDPVVQMVSPHVIMDVVVHERSLSRGLPFTCPPPEQYFNPTTYNFDASCLLNSGIVHITCSGYQKETLSFLKKAAPCSSEVISTSYSNCLISGLLSSRLADTQASSLSQEEQLDAILSTAVETSSLGLITGCIKQWTEEEQPGSALNLRYILDWAWSKVVETKDELDGICAPLFDSSSNFTDPQTLQLLQHSQRLLSNLSAIFHCLLSEAKALTQKGLAGLMNKNVVSTLISKYAQVVLWFCRTGLLPEGSEDDALQISRPFYSHSVISNYYTIRREELTRLAKGKWCADCLMIDGLVSQCGERLASLWRRDEGGTGQYPPPSLHALLDIYLLDDIDEAAKHAIVIYLLLDVMYSFPNKDGTSVESFPTAFAIPVGLVKLVQGLWLLDHHDHQSSFEILLHPAASQCHFEWQHERVLHALMCQGQQSVALRYFHLTNPPITTTSQAKLCLSVLLHNRCLLEAWTLLRQHSNRLNMSELLGFLYESCQELSLTKELLKLPLGNNEQECLEKFLQGTGGLQNRELLMVHYLQQANYIAALQLNQSLKINFVNERDPKLKERATARNSIMDQYSKVLPRVQRKLAMERAKPYQHPSTYHREVSRPQPLSTITKPSLNEKVMSRAGFINNVLTKIEEVWLGKETTPTSSPSKSPVAETPQNPKSSSQAFSEPFIGTPITMNARRKSRLKDLVIQPSYPSPRPFLSPLRPPPSWFSPKSTSKAPELSLLQTPQVVKRARALASAGPVFSGFTPQSILRSSLRPTPVATPSASPGRSTTPPLSRKESRITFFDESESPETEKGIPWTNGVAAESEISLLTRGVTLPKAICETWPSRLAEEEEEEEPSLAKFLPPQGSVSSPQLRHSGNESSSIHEVPTETKTSDSAHARLRLSLDTSQPPVPSTDTTLEYFDAPLSEDLGAEDEFPVGQSSDKEEEVEEPLMDTQPSLPLTAEDANKEEEPKEMETLEDVIAYEPQAETQEMEDALSKGEGEQDIESDIEQKPVSPDQEEEPLSSQDNEEETENSAAPTEVEFEELPTRAEEQVVHSEDAETPELIERPQTPEQTSNQPTEDLEQSTNLTEFVQRHLFGSDLSSPLTRSGIHNTSQTSVHSEASDEDEGEEKQQQLAFDEAPPVITSQKSITSVTSSELAGTDSHSVVSLNDSEELTSPTSEEEDDDEEGSETTEEEENEEEEEDSGSEVEIIAEVQGNGRMSPLQCSSTLNQGDAQFLPVLSEHGAPDFSLIPPEAEIKMEENLHGEVLMVRLGSDYGEVDPEQDVDQGSSYMELKPSSTILTLPLEVMEGHSDQLGFAELQSPVVVDDLLSETHSSFTLMLDMDTDKASSDVPEENDIQASDLPVQPQAVDDSDRLICEPQVILLETDELDSPQLEEEAQEDEQEEVETSDGNDPDDLQTPKEDDVLMDIQTCAQEEVEDAPKYEESVLAAEENDAAFPICDPVEEMPEMGDEENPVVKSEVLQEDVEEDTPTSPQQQQEQENGPVDTEIDLSNEDESAVKVELQEEQQDDHQTPAEPEDNDREIMKAEIKNEDKKEQEVNIIVEEKPVIQCLNSDDQPVPATPTSLKTNAPAFLSQSVGKHSKTVTFISPLAEEEDEPNMEGNLDETKSSARVSAAARRTPRKAKEVTDGNVQASTPRRSSRRTRTDLSNNAVEEMDAANCETKVTDPLKSSSPSRRSRRIVRARLQTESSADSDANEGETTEDQVPNTRSQQVSSKTPTPAKRKGTPVKTPRRSVRISSSVDEEPAALDVVKEEQEQDEESSPPVKRSSRRTKTEPTEWLPALLEVEEATPPCPTRITRLSHRISLNVYPTVKLVPVSLPKSVRKLDAALTENIKESENLQEPEQSRSASKNNSRRSTRTKLWNHSEEDHPLLDSPLEVDSETPVADALIKRLQDEEEKQEIITITETVKSSRRKTKSSKEDIHTEKDDVSSKHGGEEADPSKNSFIYSPSRRRTRAHKAESPGPTEESTAPVTRRRVKVVTQNDIISSEEDHLEAEKAPAVSKTRLQGKRTRSKAVSEPPPIAEVELISPLPSPAGASPRSQRRIKEELPPTSRNLRRRRVLNAVFTKPVTRRKKL